MRRSWSQHGETKRQDASYTPSDHDKIKFNINLYLAQAADFLFEDNGTANALILDSNDLGTTASLLAFDFKPEHIYIPNFYKNQTEYVAMKSKVPMLACYPIALDSFIRAWEESSNDKTFVHKLFAQFEDENITKFVPTENRPLLEGTLKRFDHIQFAYLDFCSTFKTNKNTVLNMFEKNIFDGSSPYILAVTGSFHGILGITYETLLQQYRDEIIEKARTRGYMNLRADQYFVYTRFHQEGHVEESIGHANIDEVRPDRMSAYPHASPMFFMSFIGGCSADILAAWDTQFQPCDGITCKRLLEHKKCLYLPGNQKPYCNERITEFYLFDENNKVFAHRPDFEIRFQTVPMKQNDVWEKLGRYNTGVWRKEKFCKKTFNNNKETFIDVTEIQNRVNAARTGLTPVGLTTQADQGTVLHLDDTVLIESPIGNGYVTIECVLDPIIGIHFVDYRDIGRSGQTALSKTKKDEEKEACFLLHKDILEKWIRYPSRGPITESVSTLEYAETVPSTPPASPKLRPRTPPQIEYAKMVPVTPPASPELRPQTPPPELRPATPGKQLYDINGEPYSDVAYTKKIKHFTIFIKRSGEQLFTREMLELNDFPNAKKDIGKLLYSEETTDVDPPIRRVCKYIYGRIKTNGKNNNDMTRYDENGIKLYVDLERARRQNQIEKNKIKRELRKARLAQENKPIKPISGKRKPQVKSSTDGGERSLRQRTEDEKKKRKAQPVDEARSVRRRTRRKIKRVNYAEQDVEEGYTPGSEIIVNKQHATVQRVRGKTVFYTIDATGEEGSFTLSDIRF